MLESSSKKKKKRKMDLFDSALTQSLHLQRKFGRLISGGPQSAIRQDVTTITLLKDTSTQGSSRVNKSPCNTKHSSLLYHFYDLCWFPLLLCLRCATKTDKREQNRFNEDKCANLVCTNVAFQVSSDAFFSPPLAENAPSLNHCNKADPSQISDSSGGGRQRPRCTLISSL